MNKLIILIFALLSTNCFAQNFWICADQIKPDDDSLGANCDIYKIMIPAGWIVKYRNGYGGAYVFVPDEQHRWK